MDLLRSEQSEGVAKTAATRNYIIDFGAGVGSNFATFTRSDIAINGSSMVVTMQFNELNSTTKGFYIDNIVITPAGGGSSVSFDGKIYHSSNDGILQTTEFLEDHAALLLLANYLQKEKVNMKLKLPNFCSV
jgi:hypothetical protein